MNGEEFPGGSGTFKELGRLKDTKLGNMRKVAHESLEENMMTRIIFEGIFRLRGFLGKD